MPSLQKFKRLRIYQQSSFTEDNSGTLGDYLDMDVLEDSIDGKGPTESLPVRNLRQRRNAIREDVLGVKSSSLDFQFYLCSHGLDLDGDVAPVDNTSWWQARLLGAMYGGINTESQPGVQTTVQSGTTSTVVNVTAGHGARFGKGVAIGCIVAGAYEVREVLSVSTDAVSVKVAFSGTPTTGQPVRRSVTIYRSNTPSAFLSFCEEGSPVLNRWHYRGMQGGLGAFSVAWGQMLTASASLRGPIRENLGSGGVSTGTPLYNTKVVANAVECLLATVGSTTRTAINFNQLTITPDMPWIMQHGSGGLQTVVTQVPGAPADSPLTIQIVEPMDDLSRFTSRDNSTDHAIFTQFGNTVGGTILHSAPTGQIISPEMQPSEEFAGNVWTFKGREDASGATSTDEDQACERWHFI